MGSRAVQFGQFLNDLGGAHDGKVRHECCGSQICPDCGNGLFSLAAEGGASVLASRLPGVLRAEARQESRPTKAAHYLDCPENEASGEADEILITEPLRDKTGFRSPWDR